MIFVRDKGRMCNNILQYGHAYAWGREHGRETVSMRFCYKYPYFAIGGTRHHNFITYVAAKYAAKCGLMPTVRFDTEGEDTAGKELVMLTSRNVMVEGWYVRFYDLFIKYKADIVRLFAFKPSITEKIRKYIDTEAAGCDIKLGLHIRRGDYKTWHGGKYYYDDSTYAALARQFAALHQGRRLCVFVCGNDPGLDRACYVEALPGATVAFAAGNPAEDLCLLSECDYIMGAPSTFSLVAAMYNDKPLCWVYDKDQNLGSETFGSFDCLFRHIE